MNIGQTQLNGATLPCPEQNNEYGCQPGTTGLAQGNAKQDSDGKHNCHYPFQLASFKQIDNTCQPHTQQGRHIVRLSKVGCWAGTVGQWKDPIQIAITQPLAERQANRYQCPDNQEPGKTTGEVERQSGMNIVLQV